jgi:hypothetical protein
MAAVNTHFTLTNADGGYLCEGKDIKGGYFVIDALENISDRITEKGSLCFVTGSENEPINKFYQYDGTAWVEAKFGGNDGTNDYITIGETKITEAQLIKILNLIDTIE